METADGGEHHEVRATDAPSRIETASAVKCEVDERM
jgi:hypothetical protein